jgi:uncharacterized protein (DUF885 family)
MFGCVGNGGPGSRQLQRLFDDEWEFRLRENPLFATQAGDHRYDDKLPAVSLADAKRRAATQGKFLDRLHGISRSDLSSQEQLNYDIFGRILEQRAAEYEFAGYLMPITHMGGFHADFAELPEHVVLNTTKDYENYIARLNAFKAYTAGKIELMRAGIEQGFVLPKVAAKDIKGSIDPHIVTDPNESLLFKPFERFPEMISQDDRQRLSEAAREAIIDSVVPGYESLLKFVTDEYVPASRSSIAATALPNGEAFYEHRVRHHTTPEHTPGKIHEIGLTEVKRIKAEMMDIIKEVDFEGDLKQFVEFLRSDEHFHAETPEALMKEVAFVLKKVDGELPRFFKTLPRMSFGLKQIPDYIAPESPAAYYSEPAGDGSRAAFFYVNTHDVNSRAFYTLEALCLHEAMPGHHLQIALQQELGDIPQFRRFSSFTAFTEGWALYAERLGLEMDVYKDPYSNFGRLTLEMWRACRLVVDTGMHCLGWSRQQAIDYMSDNTGMPTENVITEIDRYIVWPGQALAYKIGELKIRELRALAEHKLGDDFDIREFHDVVLAHGSIPLEVLESKVNLWAAEQIRKKEEG